MNIKKIFWVVLGCIGVGLGAVGTVLPLLPTFPFLLLAAFCFAKSSERLHTWFINTKLYKKNLESYIQGKGMTRAAKLRIMVSVTVLMGIGFTVMMIKAIYIPCIVLACVWIAHVVYFTFGVRTLKEQEASNTKKGESA